MQQFLREDEVREILQHMESLSDAWYEHHDAMLCEIGASASHVANHLRRYLNRCQQYRDAEKTRRFKAGL